MKKLIRAGVATAALLSVTLVTGCDGMMLSVNDFKSDTTTISEPETPQPVTVKHDIPDAESPLSAATEAVSNVTGGEGTTHAAPQQEDKIPNQEAEVIEPTALEEGMITKSPFMSMQTPYESNETTASPEQVESMQLEWRDIMVTTEAIEDDYELARSIVNDIYNRSGTMITGSSHLLGVAEILIEMGYQEIDASWLLNTLKNTTPETVPEMTGADGHEHDFFIDIDGDDLTYTCDCGYSYRVPVYNTPDYITKDEWKILTGDKQIPINTPSGSEYRSMKPDEYFSKVITPQLYFIVGENNYQWEYDSDTDAFDVYILNNKRAAELSDKIKNMTSSEKEEWEGLKNTAVLLSKHIRSSMFGAGFRAASGTVMIVDDDMSYIIEAKDGELTYDLYGQYIAAKSN